jgi:hypothetical protein
VIPIPYQNQWESFTECSLLKSAHFSFETTDCETGFASPHLLETNELSQSILVTISPVFGMQTANDSLISRDDETASGDKNSDICPTLVNLLQHWSNDLLPLTICWMKKMLIHSWMMRLGW